MKLFGTLAFILSFTLLTSGLFAQDDDAYMGVHYSHVSNKKAKTLGFDNPNGVYVTKVFNNSSAQKAGIKPFDFIYGMGNQEMDEETSFGDLMDNYKPGDKVDVMLYRQGRKVTEKVRLGKRSDAKPIKLSREEDAFFGIQPRHDKVPKALDYGQPVSIVGNSTAEAMGLEDGDIITSINKNPIYDWHDVSTAIDDLVAGDEIALEYYREGEMLSGAMPIKSVAATYDEDEEDQDIVKNSVIDIEDMEVEMEDLTKREAKEMKKEFGVDMPVINNLRIDQLNIFPNPNTGRFNLAFGLPQEGDTYIRAYNGPGQLIYQRDLPGYQGNFQDEVDITQNGPGTYFLMVQQGQTSVTKKVIVTIP